MAEYIKKEELIKSIVNTPLSWDYPVTPEHLTGAAQRQNEIITLIVDMPAAEVREDTKTKWKREGDIPNVFNCSNCGIGLSGTIPKYCANCGAKTEVR